LKNCILSLLIRFLSSLLFFTIKSKIVVEKGAEDYWYGSKKSSKCVYAFWHGRLLYSFFILRKMKPSALLSGSKDGDILAGVLKAWGYSLVRGSSGTGGGSAYENAVKALKSGTSIAITPDGSRGPYREAHSGAFRMAKETGVALIPIGVGFSRAWTLRSWDKFQIPKPFSVAAVVVGAPIKITDELTKISFSAKLTAITNTSDTLSVN
jgi:lysophospholipid acyltransferase (LPLAT)-like uncharacterized protein